MPQFWSLDHRVAGSYGEFDLDPKYLTLAANQRACQRLREIKLGFNEQFRSLNSGKHDLENLAMKVILSSLSRETGTNPIIPASNLDFSDFYQSKHFRKDKSVRWQKLRDWLQIQLLDAHAELERETFTDTDIADFTLKLSRDGRQVTFAAIDYDEKVVGKTYCCSVYVHDVAYCRWMWCNSGGGVGLTFEQAMYLLLMRYDALYEGTPMNNRSTHPTTMASIMLCHPDQHQYVEVCASVLNIGVYSTRAPFYGSLFYDLERHFGSVGSAVFMRPYRGIFVLDLVQVVGIFRQLCLRTDWLPLIDFGVPTAYLYVKMQGSWCLEDRLSRQLINNKFMAKFDDLLHRCGCDILRQGAGVLRDCLSAKRRCFPGGCIEDTNEALQQLRRSPFFKTARCFRPGHFWWTDYVRDAEGRWESETNIYLLSNDAFATLPDLPIITPTVPAKSSASANRKRCLDDRFFNYCSKFVGQYFGSSPNKENLAKRRRVDNQPPPLQLHQNQPFVAPLLSLPMNFNFSDNSSNRFGFRVNHGF